MHTACCRFLPGDRRASARHSVLHRLRDRRAFNPDRCCHPALLCAALSPDANHYRVGDRLRHRLERFRIANCVRAFLGDTASYLAAEEEEPYSCDDTILSISCNIDDMTGEALGLATEIFMAAGALDVFTIPIQMKKTVPAFS